MNWHCVQCESGAMCLRFLCCIRFSLKARQEVARPPFPAVPGAAPSCCPGHSPRATAPPPPPFPLPDALSHGCPGGGCRKGWFSGTVLSTDPSQGGGGCTLYAPSPHSLPPGVEHFGIFVGHISCISGLLWSQWDPSGGYRSCPSSASVVWAIGHCCGV